MSDWLTKLQATVEPIVPEKVANRLLLVDGDAMAYSCSGNADCSAGQARQNMVNTVGRAMRASGSSEAIILLTSRGSHKGHRYTVATVKPYQGQRSSGHRPSNWEFLRSVLESGSAVNLPPVVQTTTAEADDLFGKYSRERGSENVVIYTQDKDMRMVPGWHLLWNKGEPSEDMVYLPPDTYELLYADQVFGTKWFWLQMLHGDTADNIPGLPKYVNEKGKEALCGPATADKLLAAASNSDEARLIVRSLYKEYWGEGWEDMLLEQAILLWMRNDAGSTALNVLDEGNPLYPMRQELADSSSKVLLKIGRSMA